MSEMPRFDLHEGPGSCWRKENTLVLEVGFLEKKKKKKTERKWEKARR